jgi:Sigma-70 region 2
VAIATIEKAISLDPNNWSFRYDFAAMRASAGLDPLAAMRKAVSLDPREPLLRDLLADIFERVLEARRPFDRCKASEKKWLYTIALNLLRDHVRRGAAGSRALERVAVGAPPPAPGERELESIEQRDSLQRALAFGGGSWSNVVQCGFFSRGRSVRRAA